MPHSLYSNDSVTVTVIDQAQHHPVFKSENMTLNTLL